MNQRAPIVNLRGSRDQAHFHAFVELYTQTFTDPEEREDPAQWPGRMWVEAPVPQPQTHVLVVLSAADQAVVGGLVFEHNPVSVGIGKFYGRNDTVKHPGH